MYKLKNKEYLYCNVKFIICQYTNFNKLKIERIDRNYCSLTLVKKKQPYSVANL